jgi:hypothetical protein
MAGHAPHPGRALAVGAAHDELAVDPAVVELQRRVTGWMAG